MQMKRSQAETNGHNAEANGLKTTCIYLLVRSGIALLLWLVPSAAFSQTSSIDQDDYLSRNGLTVYADVARKWDDDITKLSKQNDHDANSEAVLFVGSSTIRLWNNLEHDVAPYPTIKRGYGGAKFCDLAIHAPRLLKGLKFRAAVVFVANDITGGVTDKEPSEIKRLARITIEAIKKENPNAKVLLLSITATPSRFAHWKRIQAANVALDSLAEELENVAFLDTKENYLNDSGQPIDRYFVEDRLHQTPEGYQLLGRLVKQKLDELLK